MVSLPTAYWMGLYAADSAQASRDMWEIASRATRRRVPTPADDRPALVNQIYQLQAELQQVQALLEQARAGWQQSAADGERCFELLCEESLSHQQTQFALDAANREIYRLRWPDEF